METAFSTSFLTTTIMSRNNNNNAATNLTSWRDNRSNCKEEDRQLELAIRAEQMRLLVEQRQEEVR